MTKIVRLATAAAVAVATFTAAPALAVTAATTPATARAQVVRPLTLTAKTNLDFGTVLLSSVVAGPIYTVTLTSAGALSCTAGLTCSTTGIPATFNASGSNNQKVFIYTAASNFTNGTTTLQVTPSAAASACGSPAARWNPSPTIALSRTRTHPTMGLGGVKPLRARSRARRIQRMSSERDVSVFTIKYQWERALAANIQTSLDRPLARSPVAIERVASSQRALRWAA